MDAIEIANGERCWGWRSPGKATEDKHGGAWKLRKITKKYEL